MLYQWIDILGILSFAISGTMFAMSKKLDIFGVIIIAFVTAIGGGTVRDLLIGIRPVTWLSSITPSLIILMGAFLGIIFRNYLIYISKSLFLFDTIGIGLFTLLGIEKAMAAGIHPALCIGLGTVSACFGGVIRDMLCNEIPIIFRKEIYASACLAGGIVYFFIGKIPKIDPDFATITGIMVVIIIRLYAVVYKKSLPNFSYEPIKKTKRK